MSENLIYKVHNDKSEKKDKLLINKNEKKNKSNKPISNDTKISEKIDNNDFNNKIENQVISHEIENNNNDINQSKFTDEKSNKLKKKPLKSISSTKLLTQQISFNSPDYKKNLSKLLEGNGKARTWKEKLELVNSMILNDLLIERTNTILIKNPDKNKDSNPELDQSNSKQQLDAPSLSMMSVYLFFLNNGQIKCAEDGTHFRPNHHANLAFSMFSFLLKNMDDSNSIIIRAILRNLPSFSDHYLASVPMTRIRDIAHRNDIPQDLKQEIKHNLQNKLHRSASPDDLKTCEYLIDKITKGNYSQDFKKEFFIFYDELKEFFNALGVEKSLNRLKETYKSNEMIQKINDFINQKNSIDIGNIYEKYEKFISLLYATTNLRKEMNKILKDESKKLTSNQTGNVNKTLLQLASTCDIELENYVFSILSSFINILDENINTNIKNRQNDYFGDYYSRLFFDLAKICLNNLRVSNIFKEETKFLEEDLEYFILNYSSKNSNKVSKDGKLLRIKAVFERCLNLCYSLNSLILDSFTQASYDVGKNLNINNESVKVYGEAFIRNHTIFQFSKIVSLILNIIREQLNLSPYVIISSGIKKGVLIHCKNLRDLEMLIDSNYKSKDNTSAKTALLVFLDEADGSEELPEQVKAVVLGHDLPQLSHLAIRARQNNSVFICVVNKQHYEILLSKYFSGKIDNFSNVNYFDFSKHAIVKGLNEFSVNIEISDANYDKFKDQEEIEDKINDENNIQNNNNVIITDEKKNLNNLTMDIKVSKRKESFDELQKNTLLEKDEKQQLNLLDIQYADYAICGSKSTNIKKLLKIKEIIEKNNQFIFNQNSNYGSGKANIGFKIPFSVCIPFGVYEFYSRILLMNSEHPNSEYSISYDLIDYDELINLEKNSILFREKFTEHLENYLKHQSEIFANHENNVNQDEADSTSNSSSNKNNPTKYLDNLIKSIINKTTENIAIKQAGGSTINKDYDKNDINNIRLLAFRSSSNLEDLNKNAGAGLFDSILGVPNDNPDKIKKAIFEVWSSLFTYRALIARRKMGVLSKMAKMAILVQEMIHSEFSFIIHTCNPVTKNKDEVFIEMAIGLGETLASANQKGSPYRVIYNKKQDQAKIINFSSFVFAYCVDYEENLTDKSQIDDNLSKNNSDKNVINVNRRICYKNEKLSNDENFILHIGVILGRIGVLIENNLNKDKGEESEKEGVVPQDIEGAYYDYSVYIVQTRPQII